MPSPSDSVIYITIRAMPSLTSSENGLRHLSPSHDRVYKRKTPIPDKGTTSADSRASGEVPIARPGIPKATSRPGTLENRQYGHYNPFHGLNNRAKEKHPFSNAQSKYLKKANSTISKTDSSFNFIEHLNYLRDNKRFPEHLKVSNVKPNGKIERVIPEYYIDLNTGEIYQKDLKTGELSKYSIKSKKENSLEEK